MHNCSAFLRYANGRHPQFRNKGFDCVCALYIGSGRETQSLLLAMMFVIQCCKTWRFGFRAKEKYFLLGWCQLHVVFRTFPDAFHGRNHSKDR